MDLETLRQDIDNIDDAILDLLLQRIEKTSQLAKLKEQADMPVYNPQRENAILDRISKKLDSEDKNSIKLLYEIVMYLGRLHEYMDRPKEFAKHTELGGVSIRSVIGDTPRALCRYISALAAADVCISDIRSQSLPGYKLMVELELVGDMKDSNFASAISVLSDVSEKFTLL